MSALIIHAISTAGIGMTSLCGVEIDGKTATGHYPPIAPVADQPACVACIRLSKENAA